MVWQSDTINPASTSPAGDITKITNDLQQLRSVMGGGTDAAIPSAFTKIADLVAQALTKGTTGGTSTAYTLTPVGVITSYVAGQSFWVTFHTASGASPTLQISGVATPPALVRYNSAGALVAIAAGELPSGFATRVTLLSATQALVEEMPPATTATNPPVRQTVLNGPVDSNGFSAFGGSTGSTTVTVSGTLTATASSGTIDRIGQITNPSWTGLSTNGTMHLYLDIAANGTCTTGSTTLLPTYRWGGADVVTSGQFTFNIQEMVGKVGNGSVATQTYRVFVGQVNVAGGVVTAISWYALMGRYLSAWTAISAASTTNFLHNLGVVPFQYSAKGATSSAGANESEFTLYNSTPASGGAWCLLPTTTQLAVQADPVTVRIAQTSSPYYQAATHCRVIANRGW